jgi:hypothetical protein
MRFITALIVSSATAVTQHGNLPADIHVRDLSDNYPEHWRQPIRPVQHQDRRQ